MQVENVSSLGDAVHVDCLDVWWRRAMSGLPHHAHMMESLWPREAFACSAIFTTNTLNFDDCVTFSFSPLDFYLITLILSTLVLDTHDRPLSDTPGETFYGSPHGPDSASHQRSFVHQGTYQFPACPATEASPISPIRTPVPPHTTT